MKIDKVRFFFSILIISIVLVLVSFHLEFVQSAVSNVYSFCANRFGWIFIVANLSAFVFSVWIALGPYAKVRLGGEETKPEYSTFSWIAMMFTTSCSAGLIVFGFIEPIYYITNPPFQLEAFSVKSYEYAQMYTHYHWGLNAWSLYVPATIAIGFLVYNRGKKDIRMGVVCESVFKRAGTKIFAYIVDIFSTFGAVVAPVTSMGLGMPLLVLLMQEVFGIPKSYETVLEMIILIVWVIVFTTSVYLGLEKGIKRLSNANVILAFAFMILVGLMIGFSDILKAEINSLGLYINNFLRMATYMDPYGDGVFVETWTIWYWAWLIVYMPMMGVFNARISKGRTLREVAVGQMIFCSLGCWVAMMTLGNYSLKLQMSGTVDLASILSNEGQAAAILAIVESMPCSKFIMFVLAVLCFIFMATTVDSSSYVAAEMTINHKNVNQHAPRWCRVLWATVACIITFVLLRVGGFSAVQTLAILIGLPLAIIMFLVIIAAVKMLRGK